MKRRARKQNLVAEINITPFTDVILVLLIIFMVATPLISQSSIKVNLPDAKSGKPLEDSKQVVITISSENLIYVGSELVTRKELRNKIITLSRLNPDLGVIVRSDKLVQFKQVVAVLDILNELGIKNLNIAATTER